MAGILLAFDLLVTQDIALEPKEVGRMRPMRSLRVAPCSGLSSGFSRLNMAIRIVMGMG
jgi:hypothetical protein